MTSRLFAFAASAFSGEYDWWQWRAGAGEFHSPFGWRPGGVSATVGTFEVAGSMAALPTDPRFSDQWHLQNTGQNGGTAGVDINVVPVWDDYTGQGVTIGIVDSGVQYTHPDLAPNYNTSIDYDAWGRDDDPAPNSSEDHATATTGTAAAAANNGTGVVGVAHGAEVAGFRMDFDSGTQGQIADNMARQVDVDISNNSWGYGGYFFDDFDSSTFAASAAGIENAVSAGRGGLGTVFVFAAGNDGDSGQDVNYHSFQNSPYTIAVGAVDNTGARADFSTPGAALLVSAPGVDIVTTDKTGSGGYVSGDYVTIDGTSFSSPIVAGTVALMLEANPNLGYRDVQEILGYSARSDKLTGSSWQINGAENWNGGGLHVSHDFGFGLVDAHAAVRLAETWTLQHTYSNLASHSTVAQVNQAINDFQPVYSTITVADTGALQIDHVRVDLDIDHTWVGDLHITLTSPDGTESVLINRPGKTSYNRYGTSRDDIKFEVTSTQYWGENGVGDWTLRVNDAVSGDQGTFNDWTLTLEGDPVTDDDLYVITDEFVAAGNSGFTIDDSAGTDTVNAAAVTTDTVLNLTPGLMSSIANGSFYLDPATLIENAYTGDGNDQLIGNTADNVLDGGRGDDNLFGGLGNDELIGGAGDDVMEGGEGEDVAVFSGNLADYDIVVDNAIITVTDLNAGDRDDGTNTLTGIEGAQFADQYVSFNFEPPDNVPPVAVDDALAATEDTALTFGATDLLANDSDANGDGLSLTYFTQPAHGALADNGDGTLTYTPDADYFGSDNFTYTVSDGYVTDTGTVAITVAPVNDQPVAADDSTYTHENTPLVIDTSSLLGNDTDVDGDTLSITALSQPGNGSVVDNGDGTLTYTPNAEYFGDDSFTYTVSDGQGASDTATVDVRVIFVNNPPVAVDDTATTDEDQTITIPIATLLGNDSDADGHALEIYSLSNPNNGSVYKNTSAGTVVYRPNPDFNGTDTFTYKAFDGYNTSNTATVTITVNPVNDAPTANADSIVTDEDTPVAFSSVALLANDTDAEGDNLIIVGVSDGSDGTVSDNGDGTYTYTPNADFAGLDTLTYSVEDGRGGVSNGTITVTVNSINDKPVAVDDNLVTDEDTAFVIAAADLLANDSDPDGDTLTLTSISTATNGHLHDFGDGTYNYRPSQDFYGTDQLTYTVSDSQGNSDTATVTITVNSVNDRPYTQDDAFVTHQNDPVTFTNAQLLANDIDREGDTLEVTYVHLVAHGELVDNGDGTYTYTPAYGFSGEDWAWYGIVDSNGGTNFDSGRVSFDVQLDQNNIEPVAGDDFFVTNKDAALVISAADLLSNDTDADVNDALTVWSHMQPNNGSVVDNEDGTFTYTPNAGFVGTDQFEYWLFDGNHVLNGKSIGRVFVTINPDNITPVAGDDTVTTDEDTPIIIATADLLANDGDGDGDALSITTISQGQNGSLTDNGDGTFTYTPNAHFHGSDNLTYNVTDGKGGNDTATVDITVNSVNDIPVAVDDTYGSEEDTPRTLYAAQFTHNDVDDDGDPLTITFLSQGEHGTIIDNGDGTYTYTPDADYYGPETFTYIVSDGNGGSDTGTMTYTVYAVNDYPVAVDDTFSTYKNTSLGFTANDLLANDYDIEGDPLSIEHIWTPPNGSIVDHGDGTYTYTPNNGFVGNDTFRVRVSEINDDHLTNDSFITVVVTPEPPAVSAADDTVRTEEDSSVIIAAADLLTNDVDLEGDDLSITDLTSTSNGTLIDNGNGTYTYTPIADFNGSDSFTYTASDGNGNSDTATVRITIDPVNDVPVAADDAVTTDEDTPLIMAAATLTGNDSDADGDALTITAVSDGANGSVALNGDGSVTYTPDANFNGSDSFSYTVSDGNGGADTATVSVTINPVNDAPIVPDVYLTVDEDQFNYVSAADLLANVTDIEGDVDPGDWQPITWSEPAHGTIWTSTTSGSGSGSGYGGQFDYGGVGGIGSWDGIGSGLGFGGSIGGSTDVFIPSEIVSLGFGPREQDQADAGQGELRAMDASPLYINYSPDPDYNGTDQYTFTVTDANGASGSGTVYITINPVNDAPVAADDTVTTQQGAAVIATPLANDGDVDGDALNISGFTQAANGTVADNGDGTLTYTPYADFFGLDSFTYTISDGQGGSDTATVGVTVDELPPNTVSYADEGAGLTATLTSDAFVMSTNGVGNTPLTGEFREDDLVVWDGSTHNRFLNADDIGLDANIDALFVRSNGNIVFSTSSSGNLNGIGNFGDEDLIEWDGTAFSMWFDAGANGIDTGEDIDAVHVLENGNLILSTTGGASVDQNGGGTLGLEDGDLFEFNPGTTTVDGLAAKTARLVFSEDDFLGNEDIDATSQLADGTTVLSTMGSATLPVSQSFADEDLVQWDGTAAGKLFDGGGNDLETYTEDIDAVHMLVNTGAAAGADYAGINNLIGTAFDDTLVGHDAENRLEGGGGDDILIGGGGNDILVGGAGADILIGGLGADTFVFTAADLGTGLDKIYRYDQTGVPVEQSDNLDLSGLFLGGPVPDRDTIDQFLRFQDDGDWVIMQVDTDGSGGSAGFQDLAHFTVRPFAISDLPGLMDNGKIIVGTPNENPVAGNDTAATDEDTPLIIAAADLLANDSDGDGDSLSVTAISNGAHGNLSDNGNGTFTYTPDANYNGADSFTYTVSDGRGGSDTGTVDISVVSVNDAPSAENDIHYTDENVPIIISIADLLSNDSDIDGGTLSVVSFTQGVIGSVVDNGDGTITYTPEPNRWGADRFTYTVSDNQGGSDTAEVIVDITMVNYRPTAVDDSVSTDEDTGIVITYASLLANDYDVDGDSLGFRWYDQPQNGHIVDDHYGTLTYTPDANFFGTDTFVYYANDGRVFSNPAIVTVTVNPIDDAPVATDDSVSTLEDRPLIIGANVLANDIDVDGDGLTITGVSQGNHGTVSNNGDGTYTYTPDADYAGPDTVTYTVSDGQGGSDIATVDITLDSVNDEPVAADDNFSTDEDLPLLVTVVDLLANDSDTEGDGLSIAAVTQGVNGSVIDNGDGTFTYTPNADFHGSDSFSYTVSDGNGGSDTATVAITVNPVNDAPVAADDALWLDEDTTLTITTADLIGNDGDAEGDSLTVTSVSQGTHGSVTNNGDGTFTYSPGINYNGADSLTYTVSDSNGGEATASISITVDPVNDAPVAADNSFFSQEDVPTSLSLGLLLAGATDVDGDNLILAGYTQPVYGTLTENSHGHFVYLTNANFYGTDSFTYTVSDGNGGSDTATMTVNVLPVNDWPIPTDDDVVADEDTPLIIATADLLANDTDIEGDSLSFGSLIEGSYGTVVNNGDGTITYTPDSNFNGFDSFRYFVRDHSSTQIGTVNVTVNPVNDAPTAEIDSFLTPTNTSAIISAAQLVSNDTDIDGDSLSVTGYTQGSNGNITDNGDGTFTYTPDTDFVGFDTFDYTVSDGSDSSTATVTVTVGLGNFAPVANDDSFTTDEDSPFIFTKADLLANDVDLNGDFLNHAGFRSPLPRDFDLEWIEGHTWSFVPDADFAGVAHFYYQIYDSSGEWNEGQVTVTVNPVNDAPVAVDDIVKAQIDTPLVIDGTDLVANDSDIDGDDLTVAGFTQAANGSVTDNGNGTLTYTANTGFSGTDVFTYSTSDGNGGSDVATVNVLVSAIDAVDDNVTTNEDAPLVIAFADLLANDDGNGNDLTLTDFSQTSNGTLTDNGDETFTYTPDADYYGSDNFTYTVFDGSDISFATVAVTVDPVNDAPVAVDALLTAIEDSTRTIQPFRFLHNDTDPDGDSLTIVDVTQAQHGSVTLNADGTVTYISDADYSGPDTFTYTISDGELTSTANAFVDVQARNDRPVAADDSVTTNENAPVTFSAASLLANDTDVDGDALSIIGFSQATGGSVSNNGDGTLTYTPNSGFTGTDSFTYTVSDGNGGSDTATVHVTVGPAGGRIDDETFSYVDASTGVTANLGSEAFVFSTYRGGSVDGVGGFADEDLLLWDGSEYSKLLDGGSVGLSASDENIDALFVRANGNIVFSTTGAGSVAGLGAFADEDLIEWDGTSFSMLFDGSESSLGSAVDIDGVHILDNGNLVLSTVSDHALPDGAGGTLAALDGDLIEYNPGSAAVDGLAPQAARIVFAEDTFVSSDDIDGASMLSDDTMVITVKGSEGLPGLGSFYDEDLVSWDGVTGDLYFDGSTHGLSSSSEDTDAVHVLDNSGEAVGDDFSGLINLIGSDHGDILVGNGAGNTLTGGGGGDILIGGLGADILAGGAGGDTLIGGLNGDTYAFAASDGVDTVIGFDRAEGDVLDFRDLFDGGPAPDAATVGQFLDVAVGDDSATLRVDMDGGGNGFTDLATFAGVPFGNADLASMLQDGTILVI